VSAFFVLGDDYNPNVAPEFLICLNKVGKAITPIALFGWAWEACFDDNFYKSDSYPVPEGFP